MRTISAIAVDLDVAVSTASDLAALLARLDETVRVTARENGEQLSVVPLRVVITVGSSATNVVVEERHREPNVTGLPGGLSGAAEFPLPATPPASACEPAVRRHAPPLDWSSPSVAARLRHDSGGIDALTEFPTEQVEPRVDVVSSAPTSLFTYASTAGSQTAVSVPTETHVDRRRRRVRYFFGDYRADSHVYLEFRAAWRSRQLLDRVARLFSPESGDPLWMKVRRAGHACWMAVRGVRPDAARLLSFTTTAVRRSTDLSRAATRGVSRLTTMLLTLGPRSALTVPGRRSAVLLSCVAIALVAFQAGDPRLAVPKSPLAGGTATTRPLASPPGRQSAPAVSPPSAEGVARPAKVSSPVFLVSGKSLSGPNAPSHDRPQPIVPQYVGSLVVESQPSGAQVFLNQEPVGVTPLLLSTVRARTYAIRLDLEGYERWSRGIYVVMDEKTSVTALMERDR
jgi:hypothetical protein